MRFALGLPINPLRKETNDVRGIFIVNVVFFTFVVIFLVLAGSEFSDPIKTYGDCSELEAYVFVSWPEE
jgi:hypothetical protein